MKRSVMLGIAIVAFLFNVAVARAADPNPYIVKAPVAAPLSWTGWHMGGNVGYGVEPTNVSSSSSGLVGSFMPSNFATDPRGPLAGVQGGFDWQTGFLVLGLEGDIDWANINATNAQGTSLLGMFTSGATASQKVDWLASVRARFGIVPTQHVLFYVTGGPEVGGITTSVANSVTVAGLTTGGAATASATNWGWTAGGGIEFLFDRTWSIGTEVRYFNLGSLNGAFNAPANRVLPNFATNFQSGYNGVLAELKFNYHFN